MEAGHEPLITFFVLPSKGNGESDDVGRLADSVPEGLCVFERITSDGKKQLPTIATPWWGYMFGNEWFDEDLSAALRAYLTLSDHDCFVLFKKVKIGETYQYFFEHRLFRTSSFGASLPIGTLVDKKVTRGLDGFILEDDRVG